MHDYSFIPALFVAANILSINQDNFTCLSCYLLTVKGCALYVDVELVGEDVCLGLEQEGLETPGGQQGGHGQGQREGGEGGTRAHGARDPPHHRAEGGRGRTGMGPHHQAFVESLLQAEASGGGGAGIWKIFRF